MPPEAFDGCPSKPWQRASAAAAQQQPGAASIPNGTSCLWNAMVAPIAGYGLRAVLHNQIESNM